jgi:two-component system sensor histidine kinase HydH
MKWQHEDFFKYFSILVLIFVISIFHYETSTKYRYLHEIYQRAYYIPILLAAYWYGPLRGVLAAILTSILYIRHIQNDWTHFPDYSFNQYAEIFLYYALALIIGFLAKKDRRHRFMLEKTSQELSEAYQKLHNTFEQLRMADRLAALGRLSAGVAHEIRNPLGSIKGSFEILESEIHPENEKYEFVKIIKEEIARLNSIVESFLKFARPPKPRLQPTSINDLVESTLILFNKRAQESGIEIRKELADNLPAIHLDRDQIRQVLLNIILNGSDSMPDGGILEIRTGIGQNDRRITVEIIDSGIGISDEELDHIFDPFFTTKAHGTGLGLSISYQLIQNHGGTIEVHNNKDKGLTFHIELPSSIRE